MFAALENLHDNELSIRRAWKSIRENIRASATGILVCYEL